MTPTYPLLFATALAFVAGPVLPGGQGTGCAGLHPIASETAQDDMHAQILVRFDNTLTEDQAANIIERIGGQQVSRMMDGQIYLIEIPYPSSRNDIINALSATQGVVYAEPNQAMRIPQDPGSGDQIGQGRLIPLPKVD